MHLNVGRNICWTAAVTDGIVNDRLKVVLKELEEQLMENVHLIRSGNLSKSMRNTLESLIIADSHAKTGTENSYGINFDMYERIRVLEFSSKIHDYFWFNLFSG